MKIKITITAILFITIAFLFTSCKQNEDKTNTVSTSTETDLNGSVLTNPIDTVRLVLADISGTWTRIDYPFSKLIFKADEVKLIEEGLEEEPTFVKFTLSSSCSADSSLKSNKNYDYLNRKGSTYCEGISIIGDTLMTHDPNGKYTIKYVKK